MIRRSILLTLALISIPMLIATAQQSPPSQSAREKADPDERTLVVPAGTQIKVEVSEENPPRNVTRTYTGKVVAPVQVDGTVAIPLLSKVTIRVPVGPPYEEVKELIQVALDSGSYDLHTDRVPVSPGSTSEMVFTLVKDVTIKR